MKYLISTTETYRIETEAEVMQAIEEAKQDRHFILTKHASQYKERKQKGEVVDTYFKLSLTKQFTDEKEPEFGCKIIYTNGMED